VPAAKKMTDLFHLFFRSKFRKRRIQMIDDNRTLYSSVRASIGDIRAAR
jgi:hypothetical protein